MSAVLLPIEAIAELVAAQTHAAASSSSTLSTGAKIGIGVGVGIGGLGLLAFGVALYLFLRSRRPPPLRDSDNQRSAGELDGRARHELPAEERPQEKDATPVGRHSTKRKVQTEPAELDTKRD